MVVKRVQSSFRDPSGFLFEKEGCLYRQVNLKYKDNYDFLMDSGLYESLVADELLIPHKEALIDCAATDEAYKIIKPEWIPFISYPYEWCFSQLKDAALCTLASQRKAIDFGMSLKDCSAYNIQFRNGKPVFIDTLSFEKYEEGKPWVAYRQFCQHFLAPLALMSYKDIRLNQLLRVYLDGIPLDLTSSLLPFHSRMRFSLLSHIHLHAGSQKRFADKAIDSHTGKMKRVSFVGLIDNLESSIKKLKWQPRDTQWADYYEDTNYSTLAMEHKKRIISEFLDKIDPHTIWDVGANLGMFSRIASRKGVFTISFDIDPAAVEKNYLECAKEKETNILPLVFDLTNPSPGIGWENRERISFMERGPADTALALALIHHLAISNNLPLDKIADFFCKICESLIIEFVPKTDSQVQRLLSSREDIFPDYNQQTFESEFKNRFMILECVRLQDSDRILYLMRRGGWLV